VASAPVVPASLRIVRAQNDTLLDASGRSYVDTFCGGGSVWLGHSHPDVVAALARQAHQATNLGGMGAPVIEQARESLQELLPDTHHVAGFYSTGMEAVEFALRFAAVSAGVFGFLGFDRAMHGKSMAAAQLGWPSPVGHRDARIWRLPFVPDVDEDALLDSCERTLAAERIAGVVLEPLHGSGGGHEVSARFCRRLADLAHAHGALLIFDELLTGFYRLGSRFFFEEAGTVPDLIVIGKAMGNGFPVSAVAAPRAMPVRPEMLAGSTFWNNPLAAAAVAATLGVLAQCEPAALAARIGAGMDAALSGLPELGVPVRGRGAMRIIEMPAGTDLAALQAAVLGRGTYVNFAGPYIRLLPPCTMTGENLRKACADLCAEIARAVGR